jgi:hypothetical protein
MLNLRRCRQNNFIFVYVKVKLSHYRPGQALGAAKVQAQEFINNRHMTVARLSALHIGRLYPPQRRFLVLISAKIWVHSRAIVQPQGLSQWKIPVTPSGIELAIFRLVAQWLNQLYHRVTRFCIRAQRFSAHHYKYVCVYIYIYICG